MTEWFYHVTCFSKVLKNGNKSYNNIQIYHKEVSTHLVRCYHSFFVEIIAESVSLIQTSKWKIFIPMMEDN